MCPRAGCRVGRLNLEAGVDFFFRRSNRGARSSAVLCGDVSGAPRSSAVLGGDVSGQARPRDTGRAARERRLARARYFKRGTVRWGVTAAPVVASREGRASAFALSIVATVRRVARVIAVVYTLTRGNHDRTIVDAPVLRGEERRQLSRRRLPRARGRRRRDGFHVHRPHVLVAAEQRLRRRRPERAVRALDRALTALDPTGADLHHRRQPDIGAVDDELLSVRDRRPLARRRLRQRTVDVLRVPRGVPHGRGLRPVRRLSTCCRVLKRSSKCGVLIGWEVGR